MLMREGESNIGLIIFILPNIKITNLFYDCLKYSFVYGFILYGVYNFTCASVFDNWNLKLALIDIMWGGFVYFISSFIGIKYSV